MNKLLGLWRKIVGRSEAKPCYCGYFDTPHGCICNGSHDTRTWGDYNFTPKQMKELRDAGEQITREYEANKAARLAIFAAAAKTAGYDGPVY